ncbi:MAG TPA: TIGR04255 family protein [Opitutaceae bacterium]
MISQLQISGPLPVRITPCPIIEAIFEARFVSAETWAILPGLLYGQIRDRYREQVNLPLLQVPEVMRMQDPALTHLPLLQFKGEKFIIQLGPRVVSLVTKPRDYLGWPAIREELGWLLEKAKAAGFVREAERIGVRYIDFFSGDIFPHLKIGAQINGLPLAGTQVDLTTVFRFGHISTRLQVTNGAIVGGGAHGPQVGSVLDVDGWVGPADADLFGQGVGRFTELHDTVKRLFFGLLKPDYLQQLNPEYA